MELYIPSFEVCWKKVRQVLAETKLEEKFYNDKFILFYFFKKNGLIVRKKMTQIGGQSFSFDFAKVGMRFFESCNDIHVWRTWLWWDLLNMIICGYYTGIV